MFIGCASYPTEGDISVLHTGAATSARLLNCYGSCGRASLSEEGSATSQLTDRVLFSRLSKKKLFELFNFQIRNIWRVDGLYFLGIEKSFGTEAASRIDEECWKTMGTLEARQLKEIVRAKEWSVPKIIEALRLTSWALDQRHKEVKVSKNRAVFRVVSCGTQLTRVRKGLTEFPCRPIRENYLKAFSRELNPKVDVTCNICPPGPHSEDTWCEWEFTESE